MKLHGGCWTGIPYNDKRHAPGILHIMLFIVSGKVDNPIYKSSDTLTLDKDGFFKYAQAKSTKLKSLLPGNSKSCLKAYELYEYFWKDCSLPLRRYVYSFILPHKNVTYPILTEKVPFWEKFIYKIFYRLMAKLLRKGLKINQYSPDQQLQKIKEAFLTAEKHLSEGHHYLVGNQFTIADIFFAASFAPLLLPPEFSGSSARLEDYPKDLQKTVQEFRNRPAGKFALRIFRDHRNTPWQPRKFSGELSAFGRLKANIGYFFLKRMGLVTWLHRMAAKFSVLKFGKNVAFKRYETVTKILNQNEAFTIAQINGPKMEALDNAFFLGMDRSPQHDREKALMEKIVQPNDLDVIRTFVRNQANDLMALTAPYEKVDVVASITRPVLVRLLDHYFGVTNPNEPMAMQWMRDIFYDLFLNLGNNAKIHAHAKASAAQLKKWLLDLIAERKQALEKGVTLDDNLLNRLVKLQKQNTYDWLDDDTIRRNMTGLIVGAVETISGSVVLVLDELLRRPAELQVAKSAAQKGDVETVRKYAYEALRFNPFNPLVIRFAPKDVMVVVKGKKNPIK